MLPRELELASGMVANRKEEPRIAPTICTVTGKEAILKHDIICSQHD